MESAAIDQITFSLLSTILLTIGSVVLGVLIAIFLQFGLQARVEKIKLISEVARKRIDAYQDIYLLLNEWGTNICVSFTSIFPELKALSESEKADGTALFTFFSVIFESEDSFMCFQNKWNQVTIFSHLWVDAKIMAQCRLISLYLQRLMSCLDIPKAYLEVAAKERNAINNAYHYAGIVCRDDFYIFSTQLYDLIAKRMKHIHLFELKSDSARVLPNQQDIAAFNEKFSSTQLSTHTKLIKENLLELLAEADKSSE